ncbi:hypothetical protein [Escherichia coli]|uniref:hypothetical protein n=1 Tax=Escherichia coli TaxID=562 RepID=UPI00198BC159|nr:hypothetical protein [Escherichia coli]HAM9853401.1 hypothetical protein [Escherichia coli]
MIYYSNAVRMRIPHDDIYRMHQHLDYLIQEEARVKTPYSFKIMQGGASDAVVLLRTLQPLHFSGERKQEVFLKNGDTVRLTTTLAVIRHSMGDNRQETLPVDQLDGYARRERSRNAAFLY